MASAARQIAIRLSVEDAQKVRDALRTIGDEGKAALQSLETASSRAASSTTQLGNQAQAAGGRMEQFRAVMGQAGFQIQDFATQVSMGGNALQALGVQGSQLLGAFGPTGAIAGAVLMVGTLAAQFLTAGENADVAKVKGQEALDAMAKSGRETAAVLRDINSLFLTATQRAANLANAQRAELRTRAETRMGELQLGRTELGRRIADEEQYLGDISRPNGPYYRAESDADRNREAEAILRLRDLRSQAQAADREIGSLQQSLKQLENSGLQGPEEYGPERPQNLPQSVEAVSRSLDRARTIREEYAGRVAVINSSLKAGTVEQEEATRLLRLAEQDRDKSLQALTASSGRMTDAQRAANKEMEAALRVQAEFYNSPVMTRSGLLSIGTMDDKAIQQIQASIRGTAQDPEKRKKDEDEATKAAQRSYEKQQQVAERTYDRIADYAGDRLADLFLDTEGGWKKTMENLRKTAITTFARIAAEALLRPIVMPIVQQFVGGGGGSTLGSVAGLALSATQTPGSTPVVQNGSLMGWAQQGSQAYSLYSKFSDGGGFNPGTYMSGNYNWAGNSAVGFVDSNLGTGIGDWLNTPLYDAPLASGLSAGVADNLAASGFSYAGDLPMGAVGTETLAGAQGAASVGSAAAGALGVAGGAYAAYQGFQRGGVGGYTQATGGVATAGLSAAAMAGLSIPVYGWIAAAVLMIVGALLPGQKPSDKTGTATLYTLSDELTEGGLDSARRSQENRDAAKNIAEAIGSLATNIGQATGLNGPVAAGLTVSVGNRDGVDIQGLYGPKLEAGKLDEDNVKMLMNAATSRLLIMAGQQTPDEDIRKVIQNSGTDDAATIMANLQWYTDTYKKMSVTAEEAAASTNAFAQSMASLRQPYDEVIAKAQSFGLATTELAARQQEATDKLIADRDRQVASILQAADDRILIASGGDTMARQMQEFYRQQDAARVSAADQVRALGAGEDVVNRLLSALVQAADLEAANLQNQDAVNKDSARLGALQTLGSQGSVLTGFLDSQAVSAAVSPQNAFAAAQEQYARALAAARAADPESADLSAVTRAAGTLLTANSAFYGEGAEGALVRNGVLAQVKSLGADLDLPQFSDRFEAAADRIVAAQNDNGTKLREVTEALSDLKEEFRSYRLSNMR